ncbi:MAG: flagellar biosynthesis protein FlhA [Candidatus Marinimicrobia bacterium]|nr:flagellar biosynthesis protein FlhA [Candidatus Neomarinimicrobiota bacterium]
MTKKNNFSNLVLAGAIVMILGIMILPLPTFLMDVMLVMNICGALIILFVALYVLKPLEFSVFPGLLLVVTLFRLSLNVATTRLILGDGYAGEIINSFGNFVVQGNYVVGTVVFLILVIINFVVITKGSTRIAEVSARFTLDAMPGKQMAIDADLNAGLLDDREAKARREEIASEADFYGAMDGAAKFVRGDAIAGLLITGVNIIGGLTIGVLQRGMSIGEAASLYSLMTIGDGLVAQIPALIISTASAIIITRATGKSQLGVEIAKQLGNEPKAAFITAAVLFMLGIVPGLPFIPFILMALLAAGFGFSAQKARNQTERERQEAEEEIPEPAVEEKIEEYLHPDRFEIEIGYGLIPMVDAGQGGNLLNKISTIRKTIALELGLIVPPIRIRDNIQLKSNAYVFKINGIAIAEATVMMNYFLVLHPDDRIDLQGIKTTEPTFGLPALWINEKERDKAEMSGYTVVEAPAVIATHLIEVLKANAYKLLDRQETQRMLDHLKESHAAVIDGLVPDVIPLGVVTKVLKNLLREKLPIRNLVTILETVADYGGMTKDPDILTEYVRASLSDIITANYKQNSGQVTIATFEPQLEDKIAGFVKNGNAQAFNLGFSPAEVNKIFDSIGEKVQAMLTEGSRPALLVSPQIRRHVKNFIDQVLPDVSVLSYAELTSDTNLKSVGAVRYPNG